MPIDGTPGDDALVGTAGDDIINGYAGNDVLRGRAGNDTLNGDDDHDFLVGGDDNDILNGGNGDDYLRGGEGDDVIDGGAGIDRAAFTVLVNNPAIGETGVQVGATVDLNIQGVAQDTGQGMDTLIGIEHASGTVLSDTLIGDSGSNWLWGGSDGTAGGGTGNDNIDGGGGDDLVEVGSGDHTLNGGTGTDALSFLGGHVETSNAGVTYSLALQGSAQATEQGSMNTSGFENVSGSLYDDILTGDALDNILAGDLGSDSLSGGDGNDTLYGDGRIWVDISGGVGGSGPITLFGQQADEPGTNPGDPDFTSGNDVLNGGKGDDDLYGGRGDDTMTGGQHSDRFIIEADSGDDIITDFKSADSIVFDPSSGVDSFSDLTLTAAPGNSTLISWGTDDSILVQGVKPNQLDATDFEFGSPAAAASLEAVAASLAHGSSFGAGYDHGMQAAAEIAVHANALMDG